MAQVQHGKHVLKSKLKNVLEGSARNMNRFSSVQKNAASLFFLTAVAIFSAHLFSMTVLQGIPTHCLFSATDSTFIPINIRGNNEEIVTGGCASALKGRGRYYTGSNNACFYLGKADSFKGIVYLQTIGQELPFVRFVSFLNYVPVSATIQKMAMVNSLLVPITMHPLGKTRYSRCPL